MAMTVNIQGKCIVSNDQDNAEKWPTIFACRPIVGDVVCSEGGKELTIVSIKHAAVSEDRDGQPWLLPKLTIVLA